MIMTDAKQAADKAIAKCKSQNKSKNASCACYIAKQYLVSSGKRPSEDDVAMIREVVNQHYYPEQINAVVDTAEAVETAKPSNQKRDTVSHRKKVK